MSIQFNKGLQLTSLTSLILRLNFFFFPIFPDNDTFKHEKHEAKKDPEHAHRHKIEEEVAAAVAVGSGGYAFHEHHEKKEAKKEDEEAHGKKHHHLFG